jgi:hypothetical protein
MNASLAKTIRVFIAAIALIVLSSLVPATSALAGEVFTPGGVAIHGYDPVAYFTEGKPVKGDVSFQAQHQGAIFHFATLKNRDTFLGDPARYAPQYGGFCAYAAANGYKATTEPENFTIVKDRLYLNYNDSVERKWRRKTDAFIRDADQKWTEVKLSPDP